MPKTASPAARRLNPLPPLVLLLGLSLAAGGLRAQSPQVRGLAGGTPHGVEHRALLIGISRYNAPCPTDPDCRNNLAGPQHDVAQLRQVLQARYGFTDNEITVLQNGDAVRPRVLKELAELAAWARPGREIFIYFSGHGTGPLNSEEHFPLPDGTGALVLAPLHEGEPMTTDSFRQQLLVGTTDVRPQLLKMDQAGADVIAVIDACFSQNSLRSALGVRERRFRGPAMPENTFAPPPVATHDQPSRPQGMGSSWPYSRVAWLAASSANEQAADLKGDRSEPTLDGEPHGALTDALLRVLTGQVAASDSRDAPSYAQVFDSTRSYMRSRHYRQTAQIMPSRLGETRGAEVLGVKVFGEGLPGAPQGTAPAVRVLKVSLAGTAASLRSVLAPIPGIQFTDEDPEYRIKPLAGPPGQWSFETGHEEAVLTNGRREPLPQATDDLRDSLALRALMRRLTAQAREHTAGLTLEAGSNDPAVGDTLHAGQRLTLMVRASRDVTVALVHLMGDGQTHVWVPASPEGVCVTDPHLKANTATQLCNWPSSAAPYGLDLIYVIAAEGRSAALEGLSDARLTPEAAKILEDVVAQNPGRVAIEELPLFTVEVL
jgi:hypothetical protein